MKKKILFTAYNLDFGGIEIALLNILKTLDYEKYDVTLLLERKEGLFLGDIPSEVKLEIYEVSDNKNVLVRKVKNRIKLWKWILKNRNKYSFAACFATYCIPGSILVRFASRNNAMWIHSNYYHVYHEESDKMKWFFRIRKVEKFKRLVFVANEARCDFIKVFPELESKTTVLNNILDYQAIIKKSKMKIKVRKSRGSKVFLFVGRLEERAKKLTRLLESFKQVSDENANLFLWIVGDGPDKNLYKKLVKKLKLSNKVVFFGKQKNPYPYMVKADLIVLTSDYEGFPVTCLEAMILRRPFLSTIDLSDPYLKLSNYGKITKKDISEITSCMKEFLLGDDWIKKAFVPGDYVEKLQNDLEKLIEGE